MSYKKIVIEDSKGTKYYPVTSVKNIPDIEKVSEYINIDNIKIDSSTSEKLGDTIINIKNDLKDHKHSANDITETNSRKFVTNAQLLDIKTISDKATKTYVDNKVKEVNQFNSVNKGNYSFDSLKEPGVYRAYNSSTSPCGTSADYMVAVYKYDYDNNVIQVAHSSASINNVHNNKVYVRSHYNNTWSGWRELTNVKIEREIDNLKLSGVESNKILVDALNSKDVPASTSDSIKTNVNKVNDIHVGDYSMGDVIPLDYVTPAYDGKEAVHLWDNRMAKLRVNHITTDRLGNVVMTGDNELNGGSEIEFRTKDGVREWSKAKSGFGDYLVFTPDDKYIYQLMSFGFVRRWTRTGDLQWDKHVGKDARNIVTDKKGNMLMLQANTKDNPPYFYKVSSSGNIIFTKQLTASKGKRRWMDIDNEYNIHIFSDTAHYTIYDTNGKLLFEKQFYFKYNITGFKLGPKKLIYLSDSSNILYMLDVQTGTKWRVQLDNDIVDFDVDRHGDVYVVDDMYMYKYSEFRGYLLWERTIQYSDGNCIHVGPDLSVYVGTKGGTYGRVIKYKQGKDIIGHYIYYDGEVGI